MQSLWMRTRSDSTDVHFAESTILSNNFLRLNFCIFDNQGVFIFKIYSWINMIVVIH